MSECLDDIRNLCLVLITIENTSHINQFTRIKIAVPTNHYKILCILHLLTRNKKNLTRKDITFRESYSYNEEEHFVYDTEDVKNLD